MAQVTLQARKRAQTGKGVARKLRAAARVPAVLYGQGMDSTPLDVDRRELLTAYQSDAGTNVLLNIEVDGESTPALTKELQRDPLKGALLHVDFVKVDLTQEVDVEVPVHIVGEAPGVKEGGVLEQPVFALQVRCLPGDVPEAVEVDVSGLTTGDSMHVSELSVSGFEILTDPETVLVSIVAPMSEAELEALEAAAGAEAPVEAEDAAGDEGAAVEATDAPGDAAADDEAAGDGDAS